MTLFSPFEQLLKSNQGKPFVFDCHDMRTLHFDEKFVQSAMSITEPNKLILSYTKAMMGFVLFSSTPKHIILVGLGGGSLVKYCYQHFPKARITVLELNADVIALRNDFLIPADNHRLQVIHSDAAKYLSKKEKNSADVILLDGFSADGPAPELCSTEFYENCFSALTANGVLVANLWKNPGELAATLQPLKENVQWNNWWCRTDDSYNYVSFFVKGENAIVFRNVLRNRAKNLSRLFDLNFSSILQSLQMSNI